MHLRTVRRLLVGRVPGVNCTSMPWRRASCVFIASSASTARFSHMRTVWEQNALAYVAALAVCSLICAGIDVLLVRHLVASEQRDMQDNRVRLLDVQTEAQRRRMREFRAETQSVHADYARFVERLDQIDTDLRNGASEQTVERSIQSASSAFCSHTVRMCENLAVDAPPHGTEVHSPPCCAAIDSRIEMPQPCSGMPASPKPTCSAGRSPPLSS